MSQNGQTHFKNLTAFAVRLINKNNILIPNFHIFHGKNLFGGLVLVADGQCFHGCSTCTTQLVQSIIQVSKATQLITYL